MKEQLFDKGYCNFNLYVYVFMNLILIYIKGILGLEVN